MDDWYGAMLNRRQISVFAVVLITAATPTKTMASACEGAWTKIASADQTDGWSKDRQIREWEARRSLCVDKETALYQMRLAMLYAEAKRFEKARGTLGEMPPESKEARHARLYLEWMDREATGIKLDAMIASYRQLVADFPGWTTARDALTRYLLFAGNYGSARDEALAALQIEKTPSSCMLLAIAAHGARDYGTAVNSGIEAVKMAPAFKADATLMWAIGDSLLELKQNDSALRTLALLIEANPGARDNPKIRDLYQRIQASSNETPTP